MKVLFAQSCQTLCNPTVCILPGSSVHGILQAGILEWVAISFSRGSSQPRDQAHISCIAGRFFTIWATWKAHNTVHTIRNLNIHWKDWCYSWSSTSLVTWCEETTHWKRPWCWERVTAKEGAGKGWDGWMESLTQCTWIWANSGRQGRTGKPGMLQSMGLQRVKYNLVTKQQQITAADSVKLISLNKKLIKWCMDKVLYKS